MTDYKFMTEEEVQKTIDRAVEKAMAEINKIDLEQWENNGCGTAMALDGLLKNEVLDKIKNFAGDKK